MIARPTHDIVWFFTHGMPVEQRRRMQSHLIDAYFDALGPVLAREFTPEMLQTDALYWAPIFLLNSALAADAAAVRSAAKDTEALSRSELDKFHKRNLAFLEDLDADRVLAALESL